MRSGFLYLSFLNWWISSGLESTRVLFGLASLAHSFLPIACQSFLSVGWEIDVKGKHEGKDVIYRYGKRGVSTPSNPLHMMDKKQTSSIPYSWLSNPSKSHKSILETYCREAFHPKSEWIFQRNLASSLSWVSVNNMYPPRKNWKGIGPPGSGKGTLCSKLSKDFGYFHFSIGDYMREMSRNSSFEEDEGAIREHLQQGKLLQTKMIIPILHRKIVDEVREK